jgi:hypothetical protein
MLLFIVRFLFFKTHIIYGSWWLEAWVMVPPHDKPSRVQTARKARDMNLAE